MACPCTNPRCPNSAAYGGCSHCLCLRVPDVGPGQPIHYAGPRPRDEVTIGQRWSKAVTPRDRPSVNLHAEPVLTPHPRQPDRPALLMEGALW